MDPIILQAYKAMQQGQSFAFATIVETTSNGVPRKVGSKMVVLADGSLFGTVGGGIYEKQVVNECLKAIKTGKPRTLTFDHFGKDEQPVCGGQMKIFVEPFASQKHLILCGAGHIALPLSLFAKMLNFKVSIIDNRKEFANKIRFPHADEIILGHHSVALAKQSIDKNTLIVIVTHGHEFDFDCLKKVVKSDAGYIGVISSKKKRSKFFSDLKKCGVANKFLKKIKMPIGLNIGAQTPEEIAVSIAAEIVQELNAESLRTSKFEAKTIR